MYVRRKAPKTLKNNWANKWKTVVEVSSLKRRTPISYNKVDCFQLVSLSNFAREMSSHLLKKIREREKKLPCIQELGHVMERIEGIGLRKAGLQEVYMRSGTVESLKRTVT